MMKLKIKPISLAVASSIAMLGGCSGGSDENETPESENILGYEATLYRTEGGFPHIEANDFGSLGFGTGYAAAQDNICFLAEDFLKYQAQKAQYLGAGVYNSNLSSDFFYQYLADTGVYSKDVSLEMEDIFEGYAAGYNRYLSNVDAGDETLPSECQDADWVKPIDADTIRRVHLTPYFLSNFAPLIASAQPPQPTAKTGKLPSIEALIAQMPSTDERLGNPQDKGSNGVAIGKDNTEGAHALLFANPHLSWDEASRFYPMHQVIPDVVNLLGANAINRASVGFGTNGDVAWTNTVSKSKRFSTYFLPINTAQPTQYYVDGFTPKDMEPTTVTVKLKSGEELVDETHSFYNTEFGIVMRWVPADPDKGIPAAAIALRVAGEDDRGMNGGAIAGYKAKTVTDLRDANNHYQHTPVNLIAADKDGNVLFHEGGPVAGLTDAQLQACDPFEQGTLLGLTTCQWTVYQDAAREGLLSPALQPSLIRTDYVTNSNDTYWLANPDVPMTGFPEIVGVINEEQTPRTRSGLSMVKRQLGSNNSGFFTADQLLYTMMGNEHYVGQILASDIVTMCKANPVVTYDPGDSNNVTLDLIDIDGKNVCQILEDWDRTANNDSVGSHIMREFLTVAGAGRAMPAKYNYNIAFDVNDPVNTPRELDTANNPEVLIDLAKAVQAIQARGIALDAELGDIQYVTRNGEQIPIHGGRENEGVFNKMSLGGGSGDYAEVTGSSGSWIMNTALTDDGPEVKALLTYSISTNPDSENYSNQTERFSNKDFIEIPYHLDDVKNQATDTKSLSQSSDSCADDGWQLNVSIFSSEDECRDHYEEVAENRLTDFADD